MSDLILYTTEDGKSRVQLRADGETVWLSQREMGELFNVSTDNVGLHLKNIFEEGELSREATTEESSVVQTEGTREVRRPLTLYNLDAILAVGYRVRSPREAQFRRWVPTVQNLLLYAVTQQTAAELVSARANPTDPTDPHFGLLSWKGAKVRKHDILIAKNYLSEDEIDTLNRLVVIFLETAELRPKRQPLTPMAFWQENVGQIITANGFPLLQNAGSISHARMEQQVGRQFQEYDQRRVTLEAEAADREDEAELKALEDKIKHREK